jgi:hypothetical protein
MDAALKVLLESITDGVDIWVASNGIIVSGHTVGLVDFFETYLASTGMSEGTFRIKVEKKMADHKDEPKNKEGEKRDSPLVLFSDAKIFTNGRYLCSGPVALNPDLIAAWGPGLMTPVVDPSDYMPH